MLPVHPSSGPQYGHRQPWLRWNQFSADLASRKQQPCLSLKERIASTSGKNDDLTLFGAAVPSDGRKIYITMVIPIADITRAANRLLLFVGVTQRQGVH